uniref:Phytocyanin domain-containing protein n=1 Tax=Nelumbo nucifera TaxID=4432 RepID=A0A822YQF3_NELNU|nr:TPA_asm: hypothetical protein HUJ06_012682 [Nelumbo nucifera]
MQVSDLEPEVNMDRSRHAWAVKAIFVIVLLLILFRCVSATDHTVGENAGWELGTDMQKWSSSRNFFTGDNLVFIYKQNHNVIEVKEGAFTDCQITDPVHTYNDARTVIPLDRPGTRYFICGMPGHCALGLKIQVDVLPLPGKEAVPETPSDKIGSPSDDNTDGRGGGGSPRTPHPRAPKAPNGPHAPPSPIGQHQPPPPEKETPEVPHAPDLPVSGGESHAPIPQQASAPRVDIGTPAVVYSHALMLLLTSILCSYSFLFPVLLIP